MKSDGLETKACDGCGAFVRMFPAKGDCPHCGGVLRELTDRELAADYHALDGAPEIQGKYLIHKSKPICNECKGKLEWWKNLAVIRGGKIKDLREQVRILNALGDAAMRSQLKLQSEINSLKEDAQ